MSSTYLRNNELEFTPTFGTQLNVITSMNSKYIRFPFDKLIKERWSLEHIHAKSLEPVEENNVKFNILSEQLDYFEENADYADIANRINILLHREGIIGNAEFEQLQDEAFSMFGEGLEQHSVDNLALLSTKDNSALNNNIFPIKRKIIKQLDVRGSFIPICTKNVFQKHYSNNPQSMVNWNETDRQDYFNNIIETIDTYIFDKGDNS